MEQRVISADSHVLIRDTDFVGHLPQRHQETWRETLNWPTAPPAEAPTRPEEALAAAGRPGEWDPAERLKDMDVDGVEAEVLYLDNLAGSRFYKLPADACLA